MKPTPRRANRPAGPRSRTNPCPTTPAPLETPAGCARPTETGSGKSDRMARNLSRSRPRRPSPVRPFERRERSRERRHCRRPELAEARWRAPREASALRPRPAQCGLPAKRRRWRSAASTRSRLRIHCARARSGHRKWIGSPPRHWETTARRMLADCPRRSISIWRRRRRP